MEDFPIVLPHPTHTIEEQWSLGIWSTQPTGISSTKRHVTRRTNHHPCSPIGLSRFDRNPTSPMANHWPVQVMFNRNPSPIANIPNPRIEAQRPSPTPRVDLGRDRVDAFPQWTRMVIVRTGTMTFAAAEYALSRQQVTCFRESPPEREQEHARK